MQSRSGSDRFQSAGRMSDEWTFEKVAEEKSEASVL